MLGQVIGQKGTTIIVEIENVSAIKYPVGTQVDIDLKIHGEKRSLSANAYYWKLLGILAKKTHIKPARIHNQYLRDMWLSILKKTDGEPQMLLIPDTDQAEKEALEDPDDHIMPIPLDQLPTGFPEKVTKESGKTYRWYTELRGSRTFSKAEFSRLVDMLVQDCQDQGIETKTPDELLRLEGYEKQK